MKTRGQQEKKLRVEHRRYFAELEMVHEADEGGRMPVAECFGGKERFEMANRIAGLLNHFDERSEASSVPQFVAEMCRKRGWGMGWAERGAYLHLEASELTEAMRGKGGSTVLEEAADVLIVLMSITESRGIEWGDVMVQAWNKIGQMMARGDDFTKDAGTGGGRG